MAYTVFTRYTGCSVHNTGVWNMGVSRHRRHSVHRRVINDVQRPTRKESVQLMH